MKLTSRKFWAAVSQIVTGILMIFNFSDSDIGVIVGAIMSLSGAIIYIVTEGKIDANRAAKAIVDVQEAVEVIQDEVGE